MKSLLIKAGILPADKLPGKLAKTSKKKKEAKK